MPSDQGSAEQAITIDGIRPERIETPGDPQSVADVLAEAASLGLAVAPFGGGSSLALGNIPERVDIGLSTSRLTGIIDYEPTDLTLSVTAGSRFADVQAVLAEHGQTLPIETPLPEQSTIGGLIATGLAGPRRYGAGSLRDLLIGISAAHPSGTVTKAGGMVVKNVTGFDLMRLYLGSLGTLGVVVSANFKVLPLPRHEATLIAPLRSMTSAFESADKLRGSRVQPLALEVVHAGVAEWLVAARVEGREATVRLLVDEARAMVQGDSQVLHGSESSAWWRSYVAEQQLACGPGEAVIRCNVKPSATATMVNKIMALSSAQIIIDQVIASPGLGSLLLRVRCDDASRGGQFRQYRHALCTVADHVVVLAADPELKRGIDVWGQAPETIDVMRAIKHEFDPHRVLNPGRFAGHL